MFGFFLQLHSDGNVDQVLKRSIEDLERKRKEELQPIMPNMVTKKSSYLILFNSKQVKREEEILISLTNDQNQQRLFEYNPPVYDHQGPLVPDRTDLEQLG